ncbi:MAG TPA: bacillithiol biosynthesis cysteine-adding enzyme BshC, partial [Cytophagaceae bacterium]
MNITKIPLKDTHSFSALFIDYINGEEKVKEFYEARPQLDSFKQQLEHKKFPSDRRAVLVKALTEQYKSIQLNDKVKANIDLLGKETTYTVTTGHQLNLFTGPLYFIYKIITTINLAKKLKAGFPQYDFVPVYWMASEDHDVEEINHFYLFNQKYVWETDQKGAVGRFSLKGMEQVLEAVKENVPLFRDAYSGDRTLAQATRYLVNELFKEYGLVILDGDDKALKREFRSYFHKELFTNTGSSIASVNEKLESKGYKVQVNPREINLFYLGDGFRERIVREGDHFKVLNTDITLSSTQVEELVESAPEKLSPNVVIRPVYQEVILPNLAYIGGPGEIAYWLQLKDLFKEFQVPFPVLMPRNFALIVPASQVKRIEKLGLSDNDLFLSTDQLKNAYLERTKEQLHDLSFEKQTLEKLFEAIKQKAEAIEKPLGPYVLGEGKKALKVLEDIEKRLKKAEEKQSETEINQINNLKAKLFPEGNLQERVEN